MRLDAPPIPLVSQAIDWLVSQASARAQRRAGRLHHAELMPNRNPHHMARLRHITWCPFLPHCCLLGHGATDYATAFYESEINRAYISARFVLQNARRSPRMEEATSPRGCLVLMERGASWPAEATRELRGNDGVVVVTQVATEHHNQLWKRVEARCSELSAAGVTLTVTLLVCASDSTRQRSGSRMKNALRLLDLLPPSDSSRLVLTADRPGRGTTDHLLQLAAALVEGPGGTQVTIQVVAPSRRDSDAGARPQEPAATDVSGRVALQ